MVDKIIKSVDMKCGNHPTSMKDQCDLMDKISLLSIPPGTKEIVNPTFDT